MAFDYQLINGEIFATENARIPLNDLGLLRSYSIFDFFRVLQGIPVFLEDHLDRLFHSADVMDMELPWDRGEITAMCHELIGINGTTDAGMRIVVTGGYAEDGYTPTVPNIYIMLHRLPVYKPEVYENGGKLISTPYMRDVPSVKTTIYIQSIHYKQKMQKENAVEVLYQWQGGIAECSRSNIFFVDADLNIITPKHGILKGVTRKHVIALAENQYNVEQRPVQMQEIPAMSEAFITSTTKGVLPIRQIDDQVVGDGSAGVVTRDLMEKFQVRVQEYLVKHPVS